MSPAVSEYAHWGKIFKEKPNINLNKDDSPAKYGDLLSPPMFKTLKPVEDRKPELEDPSPRDIIYGRKSIDAIEHSLAEKSHKEKDDEEKIKNDRKLEGIKDNLNKDVMKFWPTEKIGISGIMKSKLKRPAQLNLF